MIYGMYVHNGEYFLHYLIDVDFSYALEFIDVIRTVLRDFRLLGVLNDR